MAEVTLEAIRAIMQEELKPIHQKLEDIDTRLEIVEANTGFMIKWLDAVQDSTNPARMAVGMPPRNFPE